MNSGVQWRSVNKRPVPRPFGVDQFIFREEPPRNGREEAIVLQPKTRARSAEKLKEATLVQP